jgi:hypothetical protein
MLGHCVSVFGTETAPSGCTKLKHQVFFSDCSARRGGKTVVLKNIVIGGNIKEIEVVYGFPTAHIAHRVGHRLSGKFSVGLSHNAGVYEASVHKHSHVPEIADRYN